MSDTAAEAVYTENFIAKVNKEGDYHEIIFRGEKSPHSFTLRNARGTSGIKDGLLYPMSIGQPIEVHPEPSDTASDETELDAESEPKEETVDEKTVTRVSPDGTAETNLTGTKRRK